MTTESQNDEDFASLDELATVEKQDKQETQPAASMVPEKYRGKSVDDLLKIVQDQERFIGRQAEEVGFARKMAEEAVKVRESGGTKKSEVDELEDVDFFTDPKKAVQKVVETHPEVLRAKELTTQMRREQVHNRIKQAHPDVDSIVQDPEFATWVQGNRTRVRLLQEAEHNFDAEAADELLSNFKMYKQVRTAEVDTKAAEVRSNNADAMRAAQVDSGTRPDAGKKFLRRADIIDLMKRDPARYNALQDEIMRAYAEGRVR